MDIKEKAKLFAIKAHKGKMRKSEPDKPMIIHPLSVGILLEEYGFDDNVVAAGYLHDVVEDTKYTLTDIQKEFGSDLANLVCGASEPDKAWSWEKRKQHTIDETKKLPLRNKAVICADKIHNLEDMYNTFQKNGKRDFSAFNRGEEKQRWYYESIYQSLIYNENADLPIFQRLHTSILKVFRDLEDQLLIDIFAEEREYYQRLKQLHAMKRELQSLKKVITLPKPFVIEFTGVPRTGKTTIINNLYDFLIKGTFKVELLEEYTSSAEYKNTLKKQWGIIDSAEIHLNIMNEIEKRLAASLTNSNDFILIDRGINDRQIWNQRAKEKKSLPEDRYNWARDKYSKLSKEQVDYLVMLYADPKESLKRDYLSRLALEPRSFINEKNLTEYAQSLLRLRQFLNENVQNSCFIDTTSKTIKETSLEVTSQILPAVRKRYIDSFNEKYYQE